MSTQLALLPMPGRRSIPAKLFPRRRRGTAQTTISPHVEIAPCLRPATETVNPTTGQLIALTFSGPSPGNDTSRNITKIIENTALVVSQPARG